MFRPKSDSKDATDKNTTAWQVVRKSGSSEKKRIALKFKGKGGKKSTAAALPPTINTTPSMRHTFRFVSTDSSGTSYTVTGNNLAGALGCVCYIANTSCRAVMSSVRLHRITVWPGQDDTVVSSTAEARWQPGVLSQDNKDVEMVSSLPGGITNTKAVVLRPPPKSLAGDWMLLAIVASNPIFTLECSVGSIIDVDVSCTISNNSTGATITLSAVTAVVGTFGYTPLNGSAGKLVPLGISTNF